MPVEKIPSWIERLLMPTLNEMKGELKAINTRIDSVEAQIGSLRNETKSEFKGMDYRSEKIENEIVGLRTEMIIRLDSLEKRIPVIEEITALKLKIASIERTIERSHDVVI